MMRVLIVLTSHGELGNTGHKTGFWVEEFAAPYYILKDGGAEITLASPKGGQPPIDPKSTEPGSQTVDTARYNKDTNLQQALAHTKRLSEVSANDFDAVFYPGGHGPLWDLTSDDRSIHLLEEFWKSKKPIATVCHGPAVLLHVLDENEQPLLADKNVTGFSNTEEAAAGLTKVVPFLLEDALKKRGAFYSKKEDWAPYVVKDGLLITGQNPASSKEVAQQLLKELKSKMSTV
jgi:putative intracellular protease/amidase